MSVVYVYMYSPPNHPPPPLPQESPTLVDDEAVLGEIVSGEYPLISPQHEQNLGRVLSDVVYTRFVSQIKGRHLTGHLKKKQGYLVKCSLKNTLSTTGITCQRMHLPQPLFFCIYAHIKKL